MGYTALEKKVIKKGLAKFRQELEEASEPMLAVLKKYGIKHDSDLLKKITLRVPYKKRDGNHTVEIPGDEELDIVKEAILEMFISKVNEKIIQE